MNFQIILKTFLFNPNLKYFRETVENGYGSIETTRVLPNVNKVKRTVFMLAHCDSSGLYHQNQTDALTTQLASALDAQVIMIYSRLNSAAFPQPNNDMIDVINAYHQDQNDLGVVIVGGVGVAGFVVLSTMCINDKLFDIVDHLLLFNPILEISSITDSSPISQDLYLCDAHIPANMSGAINAFNLDALVSEFLETSTNVKNSKIYCFASEGGSNFHALRRAAERFNVTDGSFVHFNLIHHSSVINDALVNPAILATCAEMLSKDYKTKSVSPGARFEQTCIPHIILSSLPDRLYSTNARAMSVERVNDDSDWRETKVEYAYQINSREFDPNRPLGVYYLSTSERTNFGYKYPCSRRVREHVSVKHFRLIDACYEYVDISVANGAVTQELPFKPTTVLVAGSACVNYWDQFIIPYISEAAERTHRQVIIIRPHASKNYPSPKPENDIIKTLNYLVQSNPLNIDLDSGIWLGGYSTGGYLAMKVLFSQLLMDQGHFSDSSEECYFKYVTQLIAIAPYTTTAKVERVHNPKLDSIDPDVANIASSHHVPFTHSIESPFYSLPDIIGWLKANNKISSSYLSRIEFRVVFGTVDYLRNDFDLLIQCLKSALGEKAVYTFPIEKGCHITPWLKFDYWDQLRESVPESQLTVGSNLNGSQQPKALRLLEHHRLPTGFIMKDPNCIQLTSPVTLQSDFEYLRAIVAKNRVNLLALCLENIPVDCMREGFTSVPILNTACFLRAWDCALYLIGKGANVNCRDWTGYTPLHHAMQYHQFSVFSKDIFKLLKTVRLLVLKGADAAARSKDGYDIYHDLTLFGRSHRQYPIILTMMKGVLSQQPWSQRREHLVDAKERYLALDNECDAQKAQEIADYIRYEDESPADNVSAGIPSN